MKLVPRSEWKGWYLGTPGQNLGVQGREGRETAVSSYRWPMGPGGPPGVALVELHSRGKISGTAVQGSIWSPSMSRVKPGFKSSLCYLLPGRSLACN